MWKRIAAPTIFISILWIFFSAFMAYYRQHLDISHSMDLKLDLMRMKAVLQMRDNVWKLQSSLLAATHGTLSEHRDELSSAENDFETALANAESVSTTLQDQANVKSVRAQFAAYKTGIRDMLIRTESGRIQPPPGAIDSLLTTLTALAKSNGPLSNLNENVLTQDLEQSNQMQSRLNTLRFALLIIPLAGLVFGFWVERRFNRAIANIRITLGDTTGQLGGALGSVAVSANEDLPDLQRQVLAVAARIQAVLEELKDVRQRAIQSERLAAVGELAAGIAHEIRNPLTSVKLLIQNASVQEPVPFLSAKQLEVVLSEILRMETTIQGLLDFARPTEMRRMRLDVRKPLRMALNLVQGRAGQQDVSISESMMPDSAIIEGDPDQLQSLFLNLAINALEAMENGGTLYIAGSVVGTTCRISFCDSGVGIPLEIMDRLFEPFVTSKERGTGLGLAISRRIVKEHGGTLHAANRPEGGAVLTVVLNLAPHQEVRAESPRGTLPNDARIHSAIAAPAGRACLP